MKVISAILAIVVATIVAAQAGTLHQVRNHNLVARKIHRREAKKRCTNRSNRQLGSIPANVTTTSHQAMPTVSKEHTHTVAPPARPTPESSSLMGVTSEACGASDATYEVTPTTGPNGSIDFLNCGINTPGGWNPPHVKVADLKTKSLSWAVQQPNSPFKNCEPYITLFEQHAGQLGLPAILLASFAMQESSCNPDTVGPNGEQGLMQLTKDKCAAAPSGNCRDVSFNIWTGASFFASLLADNGGNVLISAGKYNGWQLGMTYAQATADGNGPFCTQQNNLDYLQQLFNAWCQGVNAYDAAHRIGKYFNLDKCN